MTIDKMTRKRKQNDNQVHQNKTKSYCPHEAAIAAQLAS